MSGSEDNISVIFIIRDEVKGKNDSKFISPFIFPRPAELDLNMSLLLYDLESVDVRGGGCPELGCGGSYAHQRLLESVPAHVTGHMPMPEAQSKPAPYSFTGLKNTTQ